MFFVIKSLDPSIARTHVHPVAAGFSEFCQHSSEPTTEDNPVDLGIAPSDNKAAFFHRNNISTGLASDDVADKAFTFVFGRSGMGRRRKMRRHAKQDNKQDIDTEAGQ